MPGHSGNRISRRRFALTGGLLLSASVIVWSLGAGPRPTAKAITFGVFADPQYADKPPAMGRYYRDADEKLAQFAQKMNELRPAFVIGLGDFTDSGPNREVELGFLRHIDRIYRRFKDERHYVIGNHDLDTITKKEFTAVTGMRAAHYSFDQGPLHFVVLDANYRRDFLPVAAGNADWTESYIPPKEQGWLRADLARTTRPTIAFVHQRLDVDGTAHAVKNAARVRQILEKSGRVIAVFQGHEHRGDYRNVRGIQYLTLRGMVEGPGLENNAYALVTASPDGKIALRGFGKQKSFVFGWSASSSRQKESRGEVR